MGDRTIEGLRLLGGSLPLKVGEIMAGTNYAITEIKFIRDGLSTITTVNHECPSAYKVKLVNPNGDKDIKFLAIPYKSVESIMYTEVTKSTDEESPVKMSRE